VSLIIEDLLDWAKKGESLPGVCRSTESPVYREKGREMWGSCQKQKKKTTDLCPSHKGRHRYNRTKLQAVVAEVYYEGRGTGEIGKGNGHESSAKESSMGGRWGQSSET